MPRNIVDKLELPAGSFLREYVDFGRTLSDLPVEFHLGAGLTALSTCCGSKILYPTFGGRRAWPNLYTLLIAPSGLYRKSTAVGIAEDMVGRVSTNLVLSGEQSREKFLSILKTTPNVLYPISEFAAILSMWARDYAQGFREIVVDLFDCRQEYSRQTIKDGKTTITRPALNILAASTLDWLREKLTEGDMRGGLMGRFLIFPASDKQPEPSDPFNVNETKRHELVDFLRAVYEIQSSIVDISAIQSEFLSWSKKIERKLTQHLDPELIGFQSRVSSHCLKLSVLFAISQLGALPKYHISEYHLDQAITLATWLTDQAAELARTGFIKSRTETLIQRLLNLANNNGGISRWDALRSLHVSSREFESVVQTAVERNELTILRDTSSDKPKILYQRKVGDVSGDVSH